MVVLGVLSNLKADQMIDVLGGPNPSLKNSGDQGLSQETFDAIGEEKLKLAGSATDRGSTPRVSDPVLWN